MPDAADRARAARIIARIKSYGVELRIMPGHENRGGTFATVPLKVFDHHDASSRKSGEWGALGLILDGSPRGIPGPLSNVQIARCLDGTPRAAWVADGTCSHAGTGSGHGLPTNNANSRTYGVEKANDGLGEPYTAASNYATNAVFHAMAVECGRVPESFPLGHKEWTTRKSDPLYSMADRRRQVGAFSAGRTPAPTATPELGDLDMRVLQTPDGTLWLATDLEVIPTGNPGLGGSAAKVWGGKISCTQEEVNELINFTRERRGILISDVAAAVGTGETPAPAPGAPAPAPTVDAAAVEAIAERTAQKLADRLRT